jgi:hypothetical protein
MPKIRKGALMAKQKLTRGVNIGFRAAQEERSLVTARMEECGIHSARAFLLKMALNGYIIHLDLSELRELSQSLRAVGNNVNQMARSANESGCFYAADMDDMKSKLNAVWNRLDSILKALAKI